MVIATFDTFDHAIDTAGSRSRANENVSLD